MFPDNYHIERRKVKHARIKVSEDKTIQVIVPETFLDEDIKALIEMKRLWIKRTLIKLSNNTKINMQRDQILYFGNRYTYVYSSKFKRKVIINKKHLTILAKRDLLNLREQEKWLRREASQYIRKRVDYLSTKFDFNYNRIFIRNQKRKWGNCSKLKNLSFNWKLIKTPIYVIDYLILHELTHTQIMNHSNKFWTKLKTICPEYKKSIKWLETYGNSL